MGRSWSRGDFTTLGGGGTGTTSRSYIGRLTNTGAAIQSLSVTDGGGVVTWSRSGAAPEVWRVTFESSTDGVDLHAARERHARAGRVAVERSEPAGEAEPVHPRARLLPVGVFRRIHSIVESIALKTYQRFSDDPLTATTSLIRVVHITELRTRIDVPACEVRARGVLVDEPVAALLGRRWQRRST